MRKVKRPLVFEDEGPGSGPIQAGSELSGIRPINAGPGSRVTAAETTVTGRRAPNYARVPTVTVGSNPFADDDDASADTSTTRNPFYEGESRLELSPAPSSSSSVSTKHQARLPPGQQTTAAQKSRDSMRKSINSLGNRMDTHTSPSLSTDGPCCVDPTDENAVIRFLVSGRVFGYPNTRGTLLSNYLQYIWNNHPFLSICCMNRLNPFRRGQRLVVFINGLFLAIFLSFLFFETTYIPRVAICRMGCNLNSFAYNNTHMTELGSNSSSEGSQTVCFGGYNNGLSYSTFHRICGSGPYQYQSWMLPAISGLFVVLYQSVLAWLATCGCVQGREIFQNNCFGVCCKRYIEVNKTKSPTLLVERLSHYLTQNVL